MLLVEVMAAQWGYLVHDHTKTVWCALPLTPAN
jgi:hypothetical protein